jgi:hypothetical protein
MRTQRAEQGGVDYSIHETAIVFPVHARASHLASSLPACPPTFFRAHPPFQLEGGACQAGLHPASFPTVKHKHRACLVCLRHQFPHCGSCPANRLSLPLDAIPSTKTNCLFFFPSTAATSSKAPCPFSPGRVCLPAHAKHPISSSLLTEETFIITAHPSKSCLGDE